MAACVPKLFTCKKHEHKRDSERESSKRSRHDENSFGRDDRGQTETGQEKQYQQNAGTANGHGSDQRDQHQFSSGQKRTDEQEPTETTRCGQCQSTESTARTTDRNATESNRFSQHQAMQEHGRSDGGKQAEPGPNNQHQPVTNSNQSNDHQSPGTSASSASPGQIKSKTSYKLKAERHDPLKMKFLRKIYGKKATESSDTEDESEEDSATDDNPYYALEKQLKSNDFSCPICNSSLANRSSLISHLLNVHRIPKLPKCLRPNRSFALQLIAKYKSKVCIECNGNYNSHAKLKEHLDKRHNITIYNCSVESCHRVFSNSKSLEKHEFEHLNDVCIDL